MGVCLPRQCDASEKAEEVIDDSGKAVKHREGSEMKSMQSVLRLRQSLDKKTNAILSQIQGIPLIQLCTEEQKLKLAKALKPRDFKAGEVLMTEGEFGDLFFLITDGLAHVSVSGKRVSQLRAGDYCGEQALMNSECQRTATVKAMKDTTCLVLAQTDFATIVRSTSIAFTNRKRHGLSADDESDESDDAVDSTTAEKECECSDEVVSWLVASVKGNVLFSNLSAPLVSSIVRTMRAQRVECNESLVTEGQKKGKSFYCIESGEFVIEKNGSGIVDTIGRGACVGEMALVYNAPRNATVRCVSANGGSVYTLQRSVFKRRVVSANRREDSTKLQFLRKVPILASLNSKDLQLFSRTLKREVLTAGTTIFKQGDSGDHFYLIVEGIVEGREQRDDGTTKTFVLKSQDFFGELALIHKQARTATVMASSKAVVCLVAQRRDFHTLFGHTQLLDRHIEEYQRPTQSTHEYRTQYLLKRTLDDLITGPVIGRGKYGSVQWVKDPQSQDVYALKSIAKAWVKSKKPKQTKRRIKALFNERNVMRAFAVSNSPFLIKLRGTFKDESHVYFLMQGAQGGDFFNVLKVRGYVNESTARFYTACLIEGLDTLHKLNLMHRDLKPENIVLDARGYGMLTDFGFAKDLTESYKTYTLCGTPGYLAPEMMLGQGYGKGADWFSLGCVLYDFLTGAPPFSTGADQMAMVREMMQSQLPMPMYLSFWAKDLISHLLKVQPMKRLGVIHGGTDRIRSHPWFEGFDWNALRNGTMQAPIVPKVSAKQNGMGTNNFDISGIPELEEEMNKELLMRQDLSLPKDLKNWDFDF